VTAMTIQTNAAGRQDVPANVPPVGAKPVPTGARRRTERMVPLRSAMPGVQLVTLRHSVPLRLGALTTEDLTAESSQATKNATPQVEHERVLETTAGKGGDAR
jgi:hypothetical protein